VTKGHPEDERNKDEGLPAEAHKRRQGSREYSLKVFRPIDLQMTFEIVTLNFACLLPAGRQQAGTLNF